MHASRSVPGALQYIYKKFKSLWSLQNQKSKLKLLDIDLSFQFQKILLTLVLKTPNVTRIVKILKNSENLTQVQAEIAGY